MYQGIDLSQYQGTVDWKQIKQAGIVFAFVRAGWCGYEGGITPDERFAANMKGAAEAGIHTGVYLYSYAKTASAAQCAADALLAMAEPYQLTMPVALDFEDRQYLSMASSQNTAIAAAFLERVQQKQYYAMLYTYTAFAQTNLDMKALSAYDLWIADYRSQVGYTGSYGIWQYTGSGRVPGIAVDVDRDIAYKDYPAIIRAAGLNGLGSGETPSPAPDYKSLYEQLLQKLEQIHALSAT